MIWNTLVSSSRLMESRFFRLIQAPLMLDPTKWCWVQSVKKTDDSLLTGTHLNLQGHVWVVAQDGFHIGAKHSRELVECVHLARVYDQVVPANKIVASSR